jgi:hypothetical protein
MAIAYFQRGVNFYKQGFMSEALADYTDSLAVIRIFFKVYPSYPINCVDSVFLVYALEFSD